MRHHNRDKHSLFSSMGFSLIEIMITVAIIGILASIAMPIYRNYITTARTNRAKAELMQLPILLEQYRAESLNGYLCPNGSCNTTAANPFTDGEIQDFLPFSTENDLPYTLEGITYSFTINFTSDTAATLTATLSGNANLTVTCYYPSGHCD